MVRVFQQLVVMTAFFARLNEAEDKSSFVPDLAHKILDNKIVSPIKSTIKSIVMDPYEYISENLGFGIGIYPGTRWCGAGDVARSNKDIGLFTDTDNCCKNHDSCDDIILAGETKYELTNPSLFTRSNCKCDEEFYRCLKNVNTLISINIGALYFNKLKVMCFKYDHPRLSCKVKRGFILTLCDEYNLNTSAPKTWHFVKNQRFLTI